MEMFVVDDLPTSSPQLNCPAMRNRIAASSDHASPSATQPSTNHSCAIGCERGSREGSPIQHPISLFGPERYEPGYQYPLFLWLHSCHSSENELEGVMPALSLQNYIGCGPRGPLSSDQGGKRFVWGDSPSAMAVAEEIIFESIESAKHHFSIDSSRVFLAGFGSGASCALRIALRYPSQFAGVAAFCGQFPNEQHALANLAEARSLPILWMYGQHSERCGIQQVCEVLPVLHTAGLGLDIRQYPCGDELLTNMLSDTNSWMMQQITRQPVEPVEIPSETFSSN
jgi:phospholipase/carboxylesterase